MSHLTSLKLIAGKRQQGINPKEARRIKLCSKIDEQIRLAQGQQEGTPYQPVKLRLVQDPVTAERKTIEVPKRLKPWWWTADNGKTCITLRYGAKVLEISKGKNAIETAGVAEVITSLQLLKEAVGAGELDAQMEALSGQVTEAFAPKPKASTKPAVKA
jgi:hypothetical protein